MLTSFAQTKVDTQQQTIASASDKANIDSLTQLPQLPDSLLPSFHKVDSIRNKFNEKPTVSKTDTSMLFPK
jgi:hypothetical protein